MTLVGTGTTTYAYDAVNRMISLTDPAGAVTSYQYDSVGNRIKMTYPNGSVTNYVYDPANRLTLLENLTSTSSVISKYAYEYDTDSNKTKVTEADGSTITYAYDELHRLTSEVKKDSSNTTIYSYSYTYDSVGNRLSKTDKEGNVTNYTYDAANRIQSAGPVTYSFDANGNLISKTTASGATSYNYDYEDRPTQITYPNATATSMAYDGDDRRVSSTNRTGATTKYIFDGGNVIQETNGAGSLLANYAVEPQELMGNIVSRKDAGGANSYYHYSALANDAGNVTALTDSAQATVASYTYEAFGNMVASTGSATNAYKFSTKNLDGESGLYYFGARYYDPEVGRFITKDPSGGNTADPHSLNPYIYVRNNPLNLVDPDGQAYYDVNISVGYWGGVTGGIILDHKGNVYAYGGLGAVTPYGGAALTWSPSNPSERVNVGIQGQAYIAGAGQIGYSFKSRSKFFEIGGGYPQGASLTGYYVKRIGRLGKSARKFLSKTIFQKIRLRRSRR